MTEEKAIGAESEHLLVWSDVPTHNDEQEKLLTRIKISTSRHEKVFAGHLNSRGHKKVLAGH